jgi:hypothetical protein
LEYLSSDPSIFKDESSPQYYALTWLANADKAEIAEDDQVRLENRFALAALYFATLGGSWFDDMDFLSSVHECNWTSSDTGEGVGCNENNEITSIIIGECGSFDFFF